MFFFGRLWRRARVVTDAEFIELRYGGRAATVLRGRPSALRMSRSGMGPSADTSAEGRGSAPGAGALIEVEIRDGLGFGPVERGRLVEVEAGIGVEAEIVLGRAARGREGRRAAASRAGRQQRADRRVLAIEVKWGRAVADDDVRHRLWLRDRMSADLLDAVVVITGPGVYGRKAGIGVVPAVLLGQ